MDASILDMVSNIIGPIVKCLAWRRCRKLSLVTDTNTGFAKLKEQYALDKWVLARSEGQGCEWHC